MWDNLVDACGRGDADDEAAPVLTPREARAPSDPEAGSFDRRLSFSEDALRKSDDQADPGQARARVLREPRRPGRVVAHGRADALHEEVGDERRGAQRHRELHHELRVPRPEAVPISRELYGGFAVY